MPKLVISLAHTGRLAKAFAGRRHGPQSAAWLWRGRIRRLTASGRHAQLL